MTKHYDVVIVGGGLVGACLAHALKASDYSICVIESAPQKQPQVVQNPLDDRAIVLSKASVNILSAIGLWSELQAYATSIQDIHVSNQGRFGALRIHAPDHGEPAFGYVVLAHHLYHVMQRLLSDVEVLYDAQFLSMQTRAGAATVTYHHQGEHTVTAGLVVGADGSESSVRSVQGIGETLHDYQQKALICNVALEQDHGYCAIERFAPEGPCALLPMADKTCAVVWATTHDQADALQALPDDALLARIQRCFGYRMGKFTEVSRPFAFPLRFIRAKSLIQDRLVLIGNASQTLHPIAGQGLNLGLRDMATLAELLLRGDRAPGDPSLLRDYVDWRAFDQRHIMSLTHSLVTLFSNDFWPLAAGRSAGLFVMERLPGVRDVFARSTMGLVGRLPKMVCGIGVDAYAAV